MPVLQTIVGPRGSEYWTSFDPNDIQAVCEALKEEFRRSEPAHQIHYNASGPDHIPPYVRNIGIGFHCMKHCLVFLLRGVIFIDGQGAFVDEGCAYLLKDEKMIHLGGGTTIFVMEEGEMKGICAEETQKKIAEMEWRREAYERKRNSIGYKVLRKFRRGD
ncbi:hypothetical protein V8F33_008229 [Rhypophila sp. PSN 637]